MSHCVGREFTGPRIFKYSLHHTSRILLVRPILYRKQAWVQEDTGYSNWYEACVEWGQIGHMCILLQEFTFFTCWPTSYRGRQDLPSYVRTDV